MRVIVAAESGASAPKKRAQSPLKIAGGKAVKPQIGEAAIDVLQLAPMFGQNLRGKGNAANARAGNRDRATIGSNTARSIMAIAVAGLRGIGAALVTHAFKRIVDLDF